MATLLRMKERLDGDECREETDGTGFRLRTLERWERLLGSSQAGTVLVFKHSTTCGISAHLLAEVSEFLSNYGKVPFAIIHVGEDRSLSNAISDHTGVRHESPQIIAIRNGRSVWHASHWSIDLKELERLLPNPAE